MRILPLTLPALLVLLAACDTATVTASLDWETTLVGQPGFEAISGTAVASSVGGQTVTSAVISGATPGAVHPWHIHLGTCATNGPIVGDAGAYPPLEVGAAGTATSTATIFVPLNVGGSYFVNVHAAPGDLATIVACGDLVLVP